MAEETAEAVEKKKGKVTAVQGPVVDVKFNSLEEMPDMHETILTTTFDKREVALMVV